MSAIRNRVSRFLISASHTRKTTRPTATGRAAVELLEGRTLMSAVLPGSTVATPGTTAAAQPALAGTVVRDALIPFTITAGGHTVFKGDLQDRVIKETAAGTLDFSQTIQADAGFAASALLRYVTRADFGGVTTDVNFRTDGVGAPSVHPVSASRTTTGKTIGFDFANANLSPGTQSLFYFVKTNATQFAVNGSTTIGMEQSTTAPTGAVTLATAEPIAPPAPHLPQGLLNDLAVQQAGIVQADKDVLTHAAPRQLFHDAALLQADVSDLAFDVVAFTKAPLANVEPPLTSFLGDVTTFYAAAGRGDALATNAATVKGIADLQSLIGAATDPAHTNVTQLNKDLAATGGAIVAHTTALLKGDAAGATAALAQAAVSIPAILVDLVGGEPGGLVG